MCQESEIWGMVILFHKGDYKRPYDCYGLTTVSVRISSLVWWSSLTLCHVPLLVPVTI